MPPLLAAFLMIELGCSLEIIKAIDLTQEWLKFAKEDLQDSKWYDSPSSRHWYHGYLGIEKTRFINLTCGTFAWPHPYIQQCRFYTSPPPLK